jgi:hypothetical protein
MTLLNLIALLALSAVANAHVGCFTAGMYCAFGNVTNFTDPNTNIVALPLWNLAYEQWWFQNISNCPNFPPPPGEFLEIPANGNFTVELAHNRGQTTLSFDGQYTSEWPDGKQHPEDWHGPGNPPGCISDDGAMHTNNETVASGTAFAISYNENLEDVTMTNLVVFTVKPQ